MALLHFKQEDLSWVTKGFSVESEGSERSDHSVNACCLRVGKVQPLRDPRVGDTTQPGASLIHSRTETTREAWPAAGSIPFPHPSGDLPQQLPFLAHSVWSPHGAWLPRAQALLDGPAPSIPRPLLLLGWHWERTRKAGACSCYSAPCVADLGLPCRHGQPIRMGPLTG